ncbi:MAG: ABC transporter permease, partial [Rhodothermales bacterium]
SIAISESLAQKYFGPQWHARAMGQTIRTDNRQDLSVTGVFEDLPQTSTPQFDFVIPMEEYIQRNDWVEHWGNNGLRMFVRLEDGADPARVTAKIENVIKDHHESSDALLFLQPYTDIHLYSDFQDGQLVGGRIRYVRMFSIVALIILLIASINFMNLSTARSARRAREIGVRKAVGATKRTLVGQFIGESVLTALLALVLALGLVLGALPAFNELTHKSMAIDFLDPASWLVFLGLAVLTGLLAGSYPAFYLSSFNVIGVLRGAVTRRPGAVGMRKVLVVFQFVMSMLLIIGTMTVYTQIDYIRSKNLGMDRENLVVLNLEGGIAEQYDAFKQELLARPGIATVTTSSQNPLSVGNSTSDPTWDGKDPESEMLFHIINAHYDFFETMKMELAGGRVFSRAFATDSVNYVINEQAARAMAMDNPLGERLSFWGQQGEIIGVVKDFHIDSFYEPIEPTIIRFDPDNTWMLFVRTEAGKTQEALAGLEALYTTFNPDYPFDYRFLDESFERMYRSEVVI